MSAWTPYRPTNESPWNLKRAVHLHRRAAFAGDWRLVQQTLSGGPDQAVTQLLEGTAHAQGSPADFEHVADIIGQAATDSGSDERLRAWWLFRCLFTPNPLQERMTLLWHNHFATSNAKVKDLRLMKRQNEIFRRNAFNPFGKLLAEMARDPALLLYLDAPANRKEHPNENLAREVMELFTLGIGHYTEDDIKQAARALTGWTVRQGEFRDLPAAHDPGEKTILGQTGTWVGDDLVRILLDQRSTSNRLAWRLTREFFGEGVVKDEAMTEFADRLRERQLDIRFGVETILRSELFFSDANIGTRVADPVSFLINPLRALEFRHDPPSTLVMAEWIERMGMDLFNPPNVAGWPGGRTWLSTRTVIARANCMAALVGGTLTSPPRPVKFDEVASKSPYQSDGTGVRRFVGELLYGDPGEPSASAADKPDGEKPDSPESSFNKVLLSLLTNPQAHSN